MQTLTGNAAWDRSEAHLIQNRRSGLKILSARKCFPALSPGVSPAGSACTQLRQVSEA